ncbi:MAG: tRNA (N6-isopentenyl adenosine(37)-C2)-methylthiotransferase MiaB [Proteobacteria bacterium]|nr:tRNA (N6-isopentenyl adenosine(37)-C2)-methylthiotransferase MiaB [Pseudomonadota bacterium]MBU1388772.1 tRNA (N6-isopentenyl adenosine(37)-C2)-methylthiotransferase MiaB [Pseudomonadota bacterium]MBU1543113.1 tRNA (N6-isopentenyl adenosine(37)-C2)-methylthiotransferase MiaB [Pseudomonadota bacterium]MBU2483158.1 tRNA (N6-isopentenyl adenosine(37)-C2)-methylthiotransferase MiaB [Pseudomonadota bacterium]
MKYSEFAYIHTIGCQMNVYDSEKLMAILSSLGYEKTDDIHKADMVVCNTCSIRHKAQEKAFSFLGRLTKLKKTKPELIGVMAGCVAQQEGEKAFERIPHLDIVLGTRAFSRFARHIEAVKSGRQKVTDTADSSVIYEVMPETLGFDENQISRFVTIMQGCENFCTYCVVPYVRGTERSREPENIIEEITAMAASGVKEVTLLGQNVNSYGKKEGKISFPRLLEKINQIQGIQRIRFATSHPKDLSMDLICAIRDMDKVCNHLHLPVQSGSNAILKKMNRGYTRETYLKRIIDLKTQCPDIGLSTDMIVGFPSETRQDFEDTMNLLGEIEYDSIFAFAYSDRSSAPAAKFSDQIDEEIKRKRLNELLERQDYYSRKNNEKLTGKTVDVLVEGASAKKRDGFEAENKNIKQMSGRTQSNKIVHFPSENASIGDIIKIKIENAYLHSLWGTPAEIGEK